MCTGWELECAHLGSTSPHSLRCKFGQVGSTGLLKIEEQCNSKREYESVQLGCTSLYILRCKFGQVGSTGLLNIKEHCNSNRKHEFA